MSELVLSLISGLVGALIGTMLTIFYTEYKDKKKDKMSLSREKLEKVYAPLVALKEKIDVVNQSKGGFIRASNPEEKVMIEKIIFNYYHLIDDDLKEGIIFLHPEVSRQTMSVVKLVQHKVHEKIFNHYNKNKEILGLK